MIAVDTPTLRVAAGGLAGAGELLAATATEVGGVGDAAQPSVRDGLDALTVAWGAALEVLAEDVSFLAGEVAEAADVYERADGSLGGPTGHGPG